MERILNIGERAYENMQAVAKMLQATRMHENAEYHVTEVYFDFGQDWMWTTIVRTGYRVCQILNPREWRKIVEAETLEDLYKIAVEIKSGEYFKD